MRLSKAARAAYVPEVESYEKHITGDHRWKPHQLARVAKYVPYPECPIVHILAEWQGANDSMSGDRGISPSGGTLEKPSTPNVQNHAPRDADLHWPPDEEWVAWQRKKDGAQARRKAVRSIPAVTTDPERARNALTDCTLLEISPR
ncbi:MAG: hypothetical protein RBG13Loki_3885 [Promethearchaeota archaeon CR_4]|nr:MAG: hypothetical protein RBG13Loki_3885 [Candidatus Lokiarchaeota archaeon CR_4]